MVDLKNIMSGVYTNTAHAFDDDITPLLVAGETILGSFKSVRDGVVFTNKRIFLVAIGMQGLMKAKREFSSLPYSKLQAFSVDTTRKELDLIFVGIGSVKLTFNHNTDISQLYKVISTYTL